MASRAVSSWSSGIVATPRTPLASERRRIQQRANDDTPVLLAHSEDTGIVGRLPANDAAHHWRAFVVSGQRCCTLTTSTTIGAPAIPERVDLHDTKSPRRCDGRNILTDQLDASGTGDDASLDVLIVAQPVDGGVAVVVGQLAAAGVAAGHRITVAGPGRAAGPLAAQVEEAGAEHVEMFGDSRLPSIRDFRDFLSLRRLAKNHDLIHLHSSKAGAIGRLVAASLRTRRPAVVFTPHAWSWLVGGRLAWFFRFTERMLAGTADAIVAVSQDEANEGVACIPRHAERLRTIYNGVDRDHFTPRGPIAARDPSIPLLVCVGRLSRQKGQDIAIEALSRMRHTDAVLRFVGEGDAHPRLAQQARDLGVHDRIEWAGTTIDTAPEFRAADIVISPSRWEGLSLVFLEAMASGAVMVTTNVSGSEVIDDVGVIVEPDDSSALAAAIDSLLADEPKRRQLGVRAREHSRSFDLDANLEHNLRLWAEVTAGER